MYFTTRRRNSPTKSNNTMLTVSGSTLFERSANELTVYLGPWEVVESDSRQVMWQCSYQGERLEQFRAYDVNSVRPQTPD